MIASKSPTSWKAVWMLTATATAGYLCRVNVSTAAPLLMKEFGLSQVAMGRVFSAFLVGYAFFQIPAGRLADRLGTGVVLSKATWIWAFITMIQVWVGWGSLWQSAAVSLAVLVLLRFLLGISASPTYPASARGVSQWMHPALQARANGLVVASVGLGSALAPPLVSQIMTRWGWRSAIFVTALPALFMALLWRRNRQKFPEEISPSDHRLSPDQKKTGLALLRDKGFVLLTLSYSLQGYVGYIFVAWFYLYLVDVRHFSLLQSGWFGALPWILTLVSMPLGGWVSDRLTHHARWEKWGYRFIPMMGMGFSGIFIIWGAHTSQPVVAALTLALATALVMCVEGPFWTTMTRFAGARSGEAGGIMNMGSNLGGMISPALTPLLAKILGWEPALELAGVLAVLSALLWIGIPRPGALRQPVSPL